MCGLGVEQGKHVSALLDKLPKFYTELYTVLNSCKPGVLLSHLVGKPTMCFPNRSDTNRPVQLQKQARSLKFWSKVEEELYVYYPSSENKGADQLRGYHEADLHRCFRLCRLLVFPWGGSIYNT